MSCGRHRESRTITNEKDGVLWATLGRVSLNIRGPVGCTAGNSRDNDLVLTDAFRQLDLPPGYGTGVNAFLGLVRRVGDGLERQRAELALNVVEQHGESGLGAICKGDGDADTWSSRRECSVGVAHG